MKVIILSLLLIATPAMAKDKNKLGTDFKFNPHSVRGNYQSSDQAVATVENEKSLNKILQPRKQFKDRIKLEMKNQQIDSVKSKTKGR